MDATNYVMLDIGQPLHAFDVATLSQGTFGPRMAVNGEQLSLLGGTNLTLQGTEMVIADATRALALAGIKGGSDSGLTAHTRSLLLESATFDGGTVRLASPPIYPFFATLFAPLPRLISRRQTSSYWRV